MNQKLRDIILSKIQPQADPNIPLNNEALESNNVRFAAICANPYYIELVTEKPI